MQDIESGAGAETKFEAWKAVASSMRKAPANSALAELLGRADELINRNALEQASIKLERLLRIEPGYAQAWSRLAWIALQQDAPERGLQLAQRSISYAADNPALKSLNWMFIREAGLVMQDEAIIRKAEAMIDQLEGDL